MPQRLEASRCLTWPPAVQALSLAFLVVLASLALCTVPLLCMVPEWEWPHAALFTALLAPTDAVAVAAILRTG